MFQAIRKIIISIIGDKGGIGKTLLGYNFIYRLLQDFPSCELVDCDNDQHTSSDFAGDRIHAGLQPLPVKKMETKNLKKYLLSDQSKGIEISVIEFGKAFGEDEIQRRKALELAVKISDVVFCVMQATPVDARAFGKFEDKLPQEITKIPAILIPNRVKSRKRLNTILESADDIKYFKISQSFISDKVCYQDSFGDEGRSIFELRGFDKKNKARPLNKTELKTQQEFEKLYQELKTYICQN